MAGFWGDAVSSIGENVRQKRKSPLYGAFAFSWIAFNWKPICIFFLSSKDINARIVEVSAYASYNDQILGPAAMSALIVLLMPALHALYSYFDAIVEGVHESSTFLKQWITSLVERRKEMARVKAEIQNSVTLAEEKAKIAESNKKQAEFEKDEAMVRLELKSLSDLEDARQALNKYERELNDRSFDLERKCNAYANALGFYSISADTALVKADDLIKYIEGFDKINSEDIHIIIDAIRGIKQTVERAKSGPVR